MDDRNLKRYDGEGDDPGKSLRKFKLWASARMLTYKDLKSEQKGPWLFTLLDGKAWDACEHLSIEDISKPGGDLELWKLLEARFPEKEAYDQMGEALGAVFALAANESENLKSWTGRVRDTFEQCRRKGDVTFPAEAKGWILLHCCGMTEEQRAIVKAKTQGKLDFEVVSAALRSCFPDYKAPSGRKRATAAYVAEASNLGPPATEDVDEDAFEDVEAFLSEHKVADIMEPEDMPFTEQEAAEALAISWSERRKEIAKVRQARQFGTPAHKDRRSFRVEVEEMKRRTSCNRCGKVGHWARECRAPPKDKGQNPRGAPAASSTGASGSQHGAGYVQWDDNIEEEPSFVGACEVMQATDQLAAGLVSSPGYGVIDSGCGKTLIGENTLHQLERMVKDKGYGTVKRRAQDNVFRFGNGMTERATELARIPVGIAGTYGVIEAAIIAGAAPLLLGRPTRVKMGVKLDFNNNCMSFLERSTTMQVNQAGQLLVDILDYPTKTKIKFEPTVSQPASPSVPSIAEQKKSTKTKITLKKKECRCLLAQIRDSSSDKPGKCLVAELFSPPRFTKQAEARGYSGLAFDIKQGWDLSDPKTQEKVDTLLDQAKPRLLVACPPCTNRGGWEHLNRTYRSPLENARLLRASRSQVRFCVRQIHKQVSRGGEFLFEHPWGAETWDDSDMTPLRRKYGVRRVDMCGYGLRCPDTGLPIRKATGLMMSRRPEDHGETLHTCPGCHNHRRVEGKLKNGMNVSEYVAEYTPEFVDHMLDVCIPKSSTINAHWVDLLSCKDVECLASGPEVQVQDPPREDPVPSGDAATNPEGKLLQAVRRLHVNLGHPSNKDLVRMLQHSKASPEAIRIARDFSCDVCANHQQPSSSLPAKSSRIWEFNERIGVDIKYLPGWRPNQRVPCINIVDYASSLQIMAPIFTRENAELLKGVLRDSWIAWAGPPRVIEMDPSKPNLSDGLGEFLESMGIDVVHTAADSHWQLGKVERHGQWFEKILAKVHEQEPPTSAEQFVDNVLQSQVAKNSLITEAGASPYQIVFGRNPRVPTDLMQDDVHMPALDASQLEPAWQRAASVRQAARQAVLQCQDDRALKAALRARPRPRKEFSSGDWVYYWRSQKWSDGKLMRGGRWHGAAMVLGRLGQNWIVAHRRSIFRVSPEQLRHATSQEQTIATFDSNELLGIKTLLEKGQFPKSQFTDLVNQELPPDPENSVEQVRSSVSPRAQTAAELFQQNRAPSAPVAEHEPGSSSVSESSPPQHREISHSSGRLPRTEDYGPIKRVRHTYKSPPIYLARPSGVEDDDLQDILQDAIPQLIRSQMEDQVSTPMVGVSPRGESSKREASQEPEDARSHTRFKADDTPDADETLLCSLVDQCADFSIESLTAAFLQKKLQKELPARNNPPELQQQIDVSKSVEWEMLLGKNAVRVWSGDRAAEIKRKHPDRFIGSRFVVTRKVDEEGERVKSRWCLQGHLDPDFQEKIQSGVCHSPTLHPISRALVLQILASKKWTLQLGDVKGAFLESGPLDKKYRPLFAHQPAGGIPGVDPESVLEVTGNLYGANDAPFNWYNTFDNGVKDLNWEQSQFDRCLYYLRDETGALCGVLGAHVDDTITGGFGPKYEASITALRKKFPYRKWRIGNGEFCGVQYCQNPQTYAITYNQKEYAEHMRAINIPKERLKNKGALASEKEIAMLRAINGAANWISSQSRPDLAVQTSFSQQCFPEPKVRDLVFANQLVHRAKQYSHTEVTVQAIPWEELSIGFHSDAAFGNAKGHKTQAGYIAAFVDNNLSKNGASAWSPFAWKSFKLPRVVASTLAGEAQCFSMASAVAEWMSLLVSEAKHGRFDLRTRAQVNALGLGTTADECRDELPRSKIIGITDCKSLYDSVTSVSSVSKCEDKRVAIDLAILKQCAQSSGLEVRWCPSELMLADALTKDQYDPSVLLRAALQLGTYQLHEEADILAQKRAHREHKDKAKQLRTIDGKR